MLACLPPSIPADEDRVCKQVAAAEYDVASQNLAADERLFERPALQVMKGSSKATEAPLYEVRWASSISMVSSQQMLVIREFSHRFS